MALATLASLAVATSSLAQQTRDSGPGPSGSATVAGVVIADDSGRPVGHALVTVRGIAPAFAEIASTGVDGRFTFTGLPAGDVTITATKTTYLTAYVGAHDPIRGPAAPVTLKAGAPLDLTLRLIRGAVIAGVVTGPTGRPEGGVEVSAYPSRLVGGARKMVGGPLGHGSMTDDKGRYRIWGLAPGEYVVKTSPPNVQTSARVTSDDDVRWAASGARAPAPPAAAAREVRFAPVFYPGAVDPAQAAVVQIGAAEERDGIDVALRMMTTADIRGTVIGIDGQPGAQVAVNLEGTLDEASTLSDQAGHYSFRSVAPGSFLVSARGSGRPQPSPGPSAAEIFWASREISINGDNVDGLDLGLGRGMTATGRVTFEGATPARAAQVMVTATPAGTPRGAATDARANAAADGMFTLRGLAPGAYRIHAMYSGGPGAGGSWQAKSVLWQGQDLLDGTLDIAPGRDVDGLTVVFSDRQTDLQGTFFDSAGHPVAAYDVVVFPAERRFWTPGSRRVDHVLLGHDGRFDFSGLPAGDYLLAAVTHADPDDLADPDWLAAIAPLALHVTLADGERKIQDIRLGHRDGH